MLKIITVSKSEPQLQQMSDRVIWRGSSVHAKNWYNSLTDIIFREDEGWKSGYGGDSNIDDLIKVTVCPPNNKEPVAYHQPKKKAVFEATNGISRIFYST
jgi:hypothetical protein